jgi:hypothetical protein
MVYQKEAFLKMVDFIMVLDYMDFIMVKEV